MIRFKLLILLAALGLSWYGFKEWRLAGVVKAEPQVISCSTLAKDGYGENANVQLKDFLLSPGGYVYEEKKRGGWTKAWVPILPTDGPYAAMLRALPDDAEIPPPSQFQVILQTEHVTGEADFVRIAERDQLPGVVINEIDSLDSETKKLLRESYPGIDVDACWIVDHRRSAPSSGGSLAILAAGLAVIGFMITRFIRGRSKAA